MVCCHLGLSCKLKYTSGHKISVHKRSQNLYSLSSSLLEVVLYLNVFIPQQQITLSVM